jgi:predicted RNA-binding Zn ribbon-like protein
MSDLRSREFSYPSYRVRRPNLLGGALCLDFINTVEWRGAPVHGDRLVSYDELLIWAESAGTIDRKSASGLAARARARPDRATAALAAAIELRETIAALFSASAPRAPLLERLNDWLARAPERKRIAASAGSYAWAASDAAGDLAAPLWPVAWSAADLLISGRAARVRACTDKSCGWMFLDTSRSRRRRWCSMEGCGNRAKSRRHYRKRRGA